MPVAVEPPPLFVEEEAVVAALATAMEIIEEEEEEEVAEEEMIVAAAAEEVEVAAVGEVTAVGEDAAEDHHLIAMQVLARRLESSILSILSGYVTLEYEGTNKFIYFLQS